MASVYQHTRGNTPYWIAVYTDENGKQRHRSTRTKNREEATTIARRFQRTADKLRSAKERAGETGTKNRDLILESLVVATQKALDGTFTEHDARETLNRILEATGQGKLDSVTARTFLMSWADSKAISKSGGTAKRYRHTAETFLAHLGRKADNGITTILPRDIETFRDLQLKEGKSHATANMVVKTLRIPFNLARRQGIILTNPAEAVDLLRSDGLSRDAFTQEQLSSLLKCKDIEWRGLILLGACAGLRLGDASRLTWKSIDLEKKVIRFQPQKSMGKANSKPLEVIMLPDLEDYILALPVKNHAHDAPLFPRLSKLPVSGVGGLSLKFSELMDSIGIERETLRERKKGSKGRSFFNLGFHSLRHTFVSFMANTGVPEEIRMKLAGHTSNVHQRYTHLEIETLRNALQEFPRLLGDKGTPKPH